MDSSIKLLQEGERITTLERSLPPDAGIVEFKDLCIFTDWVHKIKPSKDELKQVQDFEEKQKDLERKRSRYTPDPLPEDMKKIPLRQHLADALVPTLWRSARFFYADSLAKITEATEQEATRQEQISQILLESLKNKKFESADFLLRYYRDRCKSKLHSIEKGHKSELRSAGWDTLKEHMSSDDRYTLGEQTERHDINQEISTITLLIQGLYECAPGGKTFIVYSSMEDPAYIQESKWFVERMKNPKELWQFAESVEHYEKRLGLYDESRHKAYGDFKPGDYTDLHARYITALRAQGKYNEENPESSDTMIHMLALFYLPPVDTSKDNIETKFQFGVAQYPLQILLQRINPYEANILFP